MATPAINIEAEVYAKIWTLLLANTNWTAVVPTANRIRYDAEEGSNDPDKNSEADGDFPKAELIGPVSGDDLLSTTTQTFGTLDADCPYSEKQLLTYELILTAQHMDVREIQKMGVESRDAIRKGGSRLGLTYVTMVRLQWSTTKLKQTENDPLPRWRQRLRIIVQTEAESEFLRGTN